LGGRAVESLLESFGVIIWADILSGMLRLSVDGLGYGDNDTFNSGLGNLDIYGY